MAVLQSFEAVLKEGKIVWDPAIKVPKEAKVKVTILPKKKVQKFSDKASSSLSSQIREAFKNLSEEQKGELDKHLRNIRNEWE